MRVKRQTIIWSLIAAMGLWLLAAAWSTDLAAALPPRPTPESEKSGEKGAYIKLTIEAAPAGLWTIVQWKDGLGDWHNVDGWQGTLDDGVTKQWWVAPDNFDTGPFRWTAYDGVEGEFLAASEEFDLPARAKQFVLVDLSVAAEIE
ncbi:MAG: hypothetical protein GY803_05815 [Chloroflexi bacterium]|nr:hypothetical protein [Chloroflexota bacterium]